MLVIIEPRPSLRDSSLKLSPAQQILPTGVYHDDIERAVNQDNVQ
jgi:hypothetical protein